MPEHDISTAHKKKQTKKQKKKNGLRFDPRSKKVDKNVKQPGSFEFELQHTSSHGNSQNTVFSP